MKINMEKVLEHSQLLDSFLGLCREIYKLEENLETKKGDLEKLIQECPELKGYIESEETPKQKKKKSDLNIWHFGGRLFCEHKLLFELLCIEQDKHYSSSNTIKKYLGVTPYEWDHCLTIRRNQKLYCLDSLLPIGGKKEVLESLKEHEWFHLGEVFPFLRVCHYRTGVSDLDLRMIQITKDNYRIGVRDDHLDRLFDCDDWKKCLRFGMTLNTYYEETGEYHLLGEVFTNLYDLYKQDLTEVLFDPRLHHTSLVNSVV